MESDDNQKHLPEDGQHTEYRAGITHVQEVSEDVNRKEGDDDFLQYPHYNIVEILKGLILNGPPALAAQTVNGQHHNKAEDNGRGYIQHGS